MGIAIDASRNTYVTGATWSTDFPTVRPLQPFNARDYDVFISKLDPSGGNLVYSTYLGGNGDDYGYGVAVDASGNAYVTGETISADFPTKGPLQSVKGWSWDAFVTKLNASGSALVYSTYLGGNGNDWGLRIGLDSSANAIVAGMAESTDFPTTPLIQPSSRGGSQDAFVAKFNAAGSALIYSTYLGGSLNDTAQSIAVDGTGTVYVAGQTLSPDFPTKNAFQSTFGFAADAFVAKIAPSPFAVLSSKTLDFGSRLVGAVASLTLNNVGDGALNISSINIVDPSGDFSQTSDCGTGLAATSNCTITVTYKPTAIQSRGGTLTITSDAPGSPHNVMLTGVGVDFTMGAGPGGSTSETVSAGGTANYNLSLTPSGFVGSATLICTWQSQQPRGTHCSVTPASVNMDGTNPAPFTVSVSTTKRSLAGPRGPAAPISDPWARHPVPLLLALLALLLPMAASSPSIGWRRRRPALPWVVPLSATLFVVLLWAACGGGGGAAPTPQTGTPAGTYTLTVTATTSGVSKTTNLTLKVN